MKIALISDSHGRYQHVIDVLKNKSIDQIIHLGDYLEDGYAIQEALQVQSEIIQGNNDYFAMAEVEEKILEIDNHRYLVTHGHKYGVYSGVDKLVNRAKSVNCDIVFFGHTHIFLDETVQNIRVVNPGSASYGRGFDQESIVIFDTITLQAERIFL